MHTIELVTVDGKSIYRGSHESLNEAIESAIKKNILLDNIDLSNTTLHHINLDGVTIKNASFKGADLTGANMSESDFSGCDFSTANLNDTCFCYTKITNCNFRLSSLKDSDISMSSLKNCDFEGHSTFDLNFDKSFSLENLSYHHRGNRHHFNTPPLFDIIANHHLIALDKVIIFKGLVHTLEYNKVTEIPTNTYPETEQPIVDLIKSTLSN